MTKPDQGSEEREAERQLQAAKRMRLRSKRVPVEEWPASRPRPVAPPAPQPVTLADMVAAETAIGDAVESSDDIAVVEVEGVQDEGS